MQDATQSVPRATKEINLTPALRLRFWSKVNKDGPTMSHMESPCWVWTAGKNRRGYGAFWVEKRDLAAHRIAWSITYGPIRNDGVCVCHRCDNPSCCRPDHLFIGDHTTNMRDMIIKGRHGSKTKPERLARGDRHNSRTKPELLARGEAHGMAKFTAEIVTSIRSLYAAGGVTQKHLASLFGVHQVLISLIIRRKRWAHIP